MTKFFKLFLAAIGVNPNTAVAKGNVKETPFSKLSKTNLRFIKMLNDVPSLIRNEFTVGEARQAILRPAFVIPIKSIKYKGSITTNGKAIPKANKKAAGDSLIFRASFALFVLLGSITIL